MKSSRFVAFKHIVMPNAKLAAMAFFAVSLIGCQTKAVEMPFIPKPGSHLSPGGVPSGLLSKMGVDTMPVPGSGSSLGGNGSGSALDQRAAAELSALGFDARSTNGGLLVYMPSNIYFDTDKSNISSSADSMLAKLASALNSSAFQKRSVEVLGHADSVGSADYNMALSERRARQAVSRLASKGVNSNRISARWFGESKPTADESVDIANRALNRRVGFFIAN